MTKANDVENSPRLAHYLRLERLAESGARVDGEEIEAAWGALTGAEVAWLRSRQGQGNHFEDAARRRKVMAILAIVPTGETSTQNQIIADFLRGLSVPERAIFAKAAHVKSPSEETWRAVVREVLARKPISEVA